MQELTDNWCGCEFAIIQYALQAPRTPDRNQVDGLPLASSSRLKNRVYELKFGIHITVETSMNEHINSSSLHLAGRNNISILWFPLKNRYF